MESIDCRADVERIALPKLVGYLDPSQSRVWSLQGAEITAKQICNRTGTPADAETFRYTIYYPDGAWSVSVRSVWHQGKVARPYRTFAVVDDYIDLEDLHGGKWAVQEFFFDWLRAVPGL